MKKLLLTICLLLCSCNNDNKPYSSSKSERDISQMSIVDVVNLRFANGNGYDITIIHDDNRQVTCWLA